LMVPGRCARSGYDGGPMSGRDRMGFLRLLHRKRDKGTSFRILILDSSFLNRIPFSICLTAFSNLLSLSSSRFSGDFFRSMLTFVLAALSLSVSPQIQSLPRDDTYHEFVILNESGIPLWVQPWPDHAAILCVHDSKYSFSADTWDPQTGNPKELPSTVSARTGSYNETRFTIDSENPILFTIKCGDNLPCPMVLNYVHTDPVYRPSAVVGSFCLFVCLFLFVFSWTLFCGACRATRKQ
jgi:hypothetical protein